MPFLCEDKSSHVRAAVLRCLHFLIKKGMCFSLVHESETAKFSSLLKQADLSADMQLKALQIFQKVNNKQRLFNFICLKLKILIIFECECRYLSTNCVWLIHLNCISS